MRAALAVALASVAPLDVERLSVAELQPLV
jgi:hypothetical protein